MSEDRAALGRDRKSLSSWHGIYIGVIDVWVVYEDGGCSQTVKDVHEHRSMCCSWVSVGHTICYFVLEKRVDVVAPFRQRICTKVLLCRGATLADTGATTPDRLIFFHWLTPVR
jgi:hypothetical protein